MANPDCTMKTSSGKKHLLVLDTSYTLEMIRDRKLNDAVLYRDLTGYFDHVWSAHPYATVIPPKNESEVNGDITITPFSERHTFIEGKIGRVSLLRKVPAINFLLSQAGFIAYLFKLVEDKKINVVRAGDPHYLGLLGLLLSWKYKIPLVIRIAGNYDKFYQQTGKPAMPRLFRWKWIEKKIERFVLKRADLVAGANEDCRDFAIKSGARKKYATLFRYGNLINPVHMVYRDDRPSADPLLDELGLLNVPFVICVARLEPVKRQDHVLRVVAEVRKRGKTIKAVLVGDGNMRDSLAVLAKELLIENEIIFAGNKDQEWIAAILPHAAAVLSPHSGRALSEAALSGAPIVAYDFEWQSELIKTGETGELVRNNEVKGMADSVIKYLNDPGYAERMGENARAKALKMMDPANLFEHERNEYSKLFARFSRTQSNHGDTESQRKDSET